jgi:cholesterol transport system auxiliary component
MMKILITFLMGLCAIMINGCSAVKMPVKNQYQLSAYCSKQFAKTPLPITLLATVPEAAAGYQTEEMLYVKKPYELEPFAKNAWADPPGDMLYPLIIQSLQHTNLFEAVTSNSYTLGADYRLDTQLLRLQQNFLRKPSFIEFSAKIVLTHVSDHQVLASKIINLQIPCLSDTPYGGVIAANKASQIFTSQLAHFVVAHVK